MAPGDAWAGLRAERLELVSRGDVVTGFLARAERPRSRASRSRSALLLAVHDAGGSASATELGIAARWIEPDLSLVAIDLPLHGHRASAKLSDRLIAGLARRDRGEEIDRNTEVLVAEFWRQATIDLVRTLDAVLALGGLDPKRIGLLGIGLGAALVDAVLMHDERPRAAVLVRPPIATATSLRPASKGSSAGSRGDARVLSKRQTVASTERLVIGGESDAAVWGAAAEAFLGARLR